MANDDSGTDKMATNNVPPKEGPVARTDANQKRKSTVGSVDLFWREHVFPDAKSLLTHQARPLNEMVTDCVVVLDTNVLLLPYGATTTSLGAIRDVYGRLQADGRLVVPAQVAREFAHHRATKLGEALHALTKRHNLQIPPRDETKYCLFENNETYKAMLKAEEDLRLKAKECQKLANSLRETIRGWLGNDPVSSVYATVLAPCVIDLRKPREEIQESFSFRNTHRVPPGYKDGAKLDLGIGDLLIWFTILDVGASRNCDVLFVTNEEKPDWWHCHSKEELFPRIELIDEFRRATSGKTFAMCKLSRLLELFKAGEAAVAETRQSEIYEEELRVRRGPAQTPANPDAPVDDAFDLARDCPNCRCPYGGGSRCQHCGMVDCD